jgi:trafficking protein particle complex subunit 13
MDGHALVFRVMRLSTPTLDLPDGLRLDLDTDTLPDDTPPPPPAMPPSHPFARRILPYPNRSSCGVSAALQLPQSFGQIFIGQAFACAVSVCNRSPASAVQMAVKVELQTERGSKSILYDSTTASISAQDNKAEDNKGIAEVAAAAERSPLLSLASGERHVFVVRHDIRELGPHQLTCSSVYTAPDGDRRFMPQVFRFSALAPLVVRTKVGRSVLALRGGMECWVVSVFLFDF